MALLRTHQGTECDLVLEKSGRIVAAIGIKYSTAPTLTKSMIQAQEDLKPKRSFVIVPETEKFQLSKQITVISLSDFLITELTRL